MSVLTLPLAQHLTALAAHSGAINIAQAAARVLYWAVRRQAKLRSALSATRCSLNLLGRLQFVNAASLLASLAAVLTSLAGESVGSKIMLKHNILRACSQALARLLESLSQEDGQEVDDPERRNDISLLHLTIYVSHDVSCCVAGLLSSPLLILHLSVEQRPSYCAMHRSRDA